jgi:hypothetical protein
VTCAGLALLVLPRPPRSCQTSGRGRDHRAARRTKTTCLQIAVTDQPAGVELDLGLPVSDRRVPLAPGPNGTVMARWPGSFLLCQPTQHLVPAISPIGAESLGSRRRVNGRRSRSRSDAAGAVDAVFVTWTLECRGDGPQLALLSRDPLTCRRGHILQDSLARSLCWGNIPYLSMPRTGCPPSWQQVG